MGRSPLGRLDRVLIGLGRVIRGLAHRAPTDFAYAGAPHKFSSDALASVMHDNFGRLRLEDVAARLDLPEDFVGTSPYRRIDAPLEHECAWLLAVATMHAMDGRKSPVVSGAVERSIGFVGSTKRGNSFGAIFYVSPLRLLQPAPLFLDVGTVRVPIVLRPLHDVDTSGVHGFRRGRMTSVVSLDGRGGALTAAHVLGDKASLSVGDAVACSTPAPSTSCQHQVLAADQTMDAAVVEEDLSGLALKVTCSRMPRRR